MTNDDKTFFMVMIESVAPEQSFFQTFWTYGRHVGEAIESVVRMCSHLGIRNAIANDVDTFNFKSLPRNVVRDQKLNVFYVPGRSYFPTEKSFIAPFGIIKASEEGKYDYSLIREGFALEKTTAGIYQVEAVVRRDRLFETFIELVKRLPSIKVFWVKVAGDWEDENREQLWTNEMLNTVALIAGFLESHWNDTVANGHVALTAYSSVGQTNLSIDTHKTIKVLTKSAKIQNRMAAALRRLKFEELAEFHSLEYGFYHYHYRPARSKPRKRLIAELKRQGFSLWRENIVSPAELQ